MTLPCSFPFPFPFPFPNPNPVDIVEVADSLSPTVQSQSGAIFGYFGGNVEIEYKK